MIVCQKNSADHGKVVYQIKKCLQFESACVPYMFTLYCQRLHSFSDNKSHLFFNTEYDSTYVTLVSTILIHIKLYFTQKCVQFYLDIVQLQFKFLQKKQCLRYKRSPYSASCDEQNENGMLFSSILSLIRHLKHIYFHCCPHFSSLQTFFAILNGFRAKPALY